VTVHQGDIIWLPDGTSRQAEFVAKRSTFFSIRFVRVPIRPGTDAYWSRFAQKPSVLKIENSAYVEGLFRRMYQLRGKGGVSAQWEMQGVLLQILATLIQSIERGAIPPHL